MQSLPSLHARQLPSGMRPMPCLHCVQVPLRFWQACGGGEEAGSGGCERYMSFCVSVLGVSGEPGNQRHGGGSWCVCPLVDRCVACCAACGSLPLPLKQPLPLPLPTGAPPPPPPPPPNRGSTSSSTHHAVLCGAHGAAPVLAGKVSIRIVALDVARAVGAKVGVIAGAVGAHKVVSVAVGVALRRGW